MKRTVDEEKSAFCPIHDEAKALVELQSGNVLRVDAYVHLKYAKIIACVGESVS